MKKPNDWFMLQRIWPGNTLNRSAVEEARLQALRLRRAQHRLDDVWTFAGPSNVGGRVTALAVHPSAPNIIYAGAAVGGVFKSTDGGLNFNPVFDQDYALSTGALAMDPLNPLRIWLGTGEANSSGDSYGGRGVYLTEDGGNTWQYKGLEAVVHIGKIAVDPTNSDRVYVAAAGELFGTNLERGLYRTTDLGSTWERVLFLTDSTACIDVALDPLHPDTVYAVMWERIRRPYQRQVGGESSGIWRSYDGGDTWTELIAGLPHGANVGRGGIAVSPANPNRLYAVFADHPGYLLGNYRSNDGGNSWQEVAYIDYSLYSSFGWYFGQIHADPVNPDVVYVQGVSMFRSGNGGQSWSEVFRNAHVDHHALWINPNNPAHLITGHDAGVNVSYNTGSNSTRFVSLPITQFYAITADPTLPYRLYGGTQDNSTPRTLGGAVDDWDVIFYGDGFYCIIDPRNSNTIYAEAQYGYLGKSTDGGYDWYFIASDFYDDRTNWMTPFVIDPCNPDALYLGTYRVWRTSNGGMNWTPISDDLTDGPGPANLVYGTVTTLALSPANSQVLYVGTDDAHVWVTTNQGVSWTEISEGLPHRWVTRVAPHPDSASVVYVSFSGYKEMDYLPHLFRSSDYGATWTDIGAGLPEEPINDVIVDPDNPASLYVGTDFGVFCTSDYGQTWEALGEGLPTSSTFD
ncbi:MAG: glycosyl hydrolase [bacterium]